MTAEDGEREREENWQTKFNFISNILATNYKINK